MSDSSRSLNVRHSREIDRCCDRFEADWSEERRPNLESYLASVDATAKDDCLSALLELEIELRRNVGETPQPEEYVARFESQQHIVLAVFQHNQPDASGAPGSSLRPQDTLAETPGSGKSFGRIPSEFGRYRIERQIGRGAMGRVFLAEDTVLGRPVALKIPSLTGHDDDKLLERFRREATAAAVLRHSNICPTFDFGEVRGMYYIAMAWIDGEPMSSIIARGHDDDSEDVDDGAALGEQQIVHWVRSLALAFAEAHRNGIVHRDIKPANVMIDTQGEPIVMDFGLAMSTLPSTDVRLTRTGMQLGSPIYMSPEQVDGDTARIGPRSDIYSLGVLFYELLTGQVPFNGPVASVFVQVITQQPAPPTSLRPNVSEELESLCLRMMSKRPEGRPESMSEIAAVLQEFQASRAAHEFDAIRDSTKSATQPDAEPSSSVAFGLRPEELKIVQHDHEAELRNLMADISTALRDHTTEGLLPKVECVLELQPDNPAMLRLRDGILKNRLTQERTPDPVVKAGGTNGWRRILAAVIPPKKKRADSNQQRDHQSTELRSWLLEHGIVSEPHEVHRFEIPLTDGGDIPDVHASMLAQLPNLHSVTFVGPKLRSLSRLAQFTSLQSLDIGETLTRDVSPLAQLANLQVLNLGGTWVSDVSPLARLTSLHALYLYGTSVRDVSPLIGLSNLKRLDLWDTKVHDLSPLSQLTGLQRLDLSGTRVSDVSPLSGLRNLMTLDLTGTQVTDLSPLSEITQLRIIGAPTPAARVTPDPEEMWVSSSSAWDAATEAKVVTLQGHINAVNSATFSPDGRLLASASHDGTVKVWDVRTGRETLTLDGHTSDVNSVAFSPDGMRLASASGTHGDGEVIEWDLETGQESLSIKRHTSAVTSVTYSPDGTRLATASGTLGNGTVKIWDTTTGRETLTLEGHSGGVLSVMFSLDGTRIASASSDKTVRVWDTATGQETRTINAHSHYVLSVAFSPDGKRLATASRDKSVKVWDAATGHKTLTLLGHTSIVTSVVFSPDGARLASASRDKTVKIWNTATGQETLTLSGHTNDVTCVAFSPDGTRLASASWDNTVNLWDALPAEKR
jgi:WD40 repeat protein/serine/threonine protein kinase